jgi:hypothetical protein
MFTQNGIKSMRAASRARSRIRPIRTKVSKSATRRVHHPILPSKATSGSANQASGRHATGFINDLRHRYSSVCRTAYPDLMRCLRRRRGLWNRMSPLRDDAMQPAPASGRLHDIPLHAAAPLPWRLADIDLTAIDVDRVRDDETLFFMLTTAAFIEIASDLYTRNLTRYYANDADVVGWLGRNWEQEEIQHGQTLRAYVRAVWPEFDWDTANASFIGEYSTHCILDEFQPSQALEMAARCVVEMGTACYYRMLHDYTAEPVLKHITDNIRSDEVRHYGNFLHFFWKYAERDHANRWRVTQTLIQRLTEFGDQDGLIAFRHAFHLRHPERDFQRADYDAYRSALRAIIRQHFPREMAMKMLLKPMRLPVMLQRPLEPVLIRLFLLAFV